MDEEVNVNLTSNYLHFPLKTNGHSRMNFSLRVWLHYYRDYIFYPKCWT